MPCTPGRWCLQPALTLTGLTRAPCTPSRGHTDTASAKGEGRELLSRGREPSAPGGPRPQAACWGRVGAGAAGHHCGLAVVGTHGYCSRCSWSGAALTPITQDSLGWNTRPPVQLTPRAFRGGPWGDAAAKAILQLLQTHWCVAADQLYKLLPPPAPGSSPVMLL